MAALLLVTAVSLSAPLSAQPRRVISATRVNTSIPLRDMAPASHHWLAPYAIPNEFHQFDGREVEDGPGLSDPIRQVTNGQIIPSIFLNFEGTSDDDNAAVVGFAVVPPDTEGDVGPNHYVQWNNIVSEIFDKSGNSLLGPFAGNQFFQGLGGNCGTTNHGDPIVLYDHLADRWLVSQWSVDGPNYECVAISTTPDPTGSYHQYEFPFGDAMPDRPKLGVWTDAYYMTANGFGPAYGGVLAVAFEREAMLAGAAAQKVIFDVPGGTSNFGWLPADLDGPPPPAGAPGLFAGTDNLALHRIELWGLDVDWGTIANSAFTLIATLPTTPFETFGFVRTTVPQPNDQRLDAQSELLMPRMQYRNFGSHQTLLVNQTVDTGGGTAGIRWYELRNAGGSWSIYQEGTYAPADGEHRWMGSIAMNGSGEIALGYSVSSSTTFPSIRFTGQTAASSGTGLMDIAETEIFAGGGAQSGSDRWGDYSAMSVDPSDDRTFWYTNEYYQTTGSFDFHTRIAALGISPIPIETTVFLEGPYDGGGQMSTLSNAHLPSEQPFQGLPWLYSGTETISSVPAEAVDWLLLELRSEPAPTSMIARQAVLLLSDGSVVDTSGVNTPRSRVSGLSSDSVYVVLWNRNHLPVMSRTKIGLMADYVTFDFTSSGASGYSGGGIPLKDLGDGRFGLFSGDADASGLLNTLDLYAFLGQTTFGASGYQTADFNLDGGVGALDFNLFFANKRAGVSSQVP
jgi:hypothetical protein